MIWKKTAILYLTMWRQINHFKAMINKKYQNKIKKNQTEKC